MLFLSVVLAAFMVSSSECGNYTVTHEVWFEVEIKGLDGPGEDYTGKFTVALFGDIMPMTVLNFVSLAKGHKTNRGYLHYKGTRIHRIVPDFVVQMGDVTVGDGTGGASIYGKTFNDENFSLSHRAMGWVSMANHGPDSNGSQFFILLNKARWLDKKHVVFGKIIRGFDVIRTIGEVSTDPNTAVPKKNIKILNCGSVAFQTPWDLKPSQLDSTDNIESPQQPAKKK